MAQQTTPDGTQWTDYVVPGTQTAGPPQTYPYQPLFTGGPGTGGMCQNGSIGSDGAWYRVCKCYGADGCFVTYQSIATYNCGNDDKYWAGKRFWVVTAIGRTKKKCGKIGIKRTVEIYTGLGANSGYEGDYTWNPGPLGEDTYPGDSDIAKLDTGTGDRPDEKSKKVEEKKDDAKAATTDNPKDQKTLKTEKTVTPEAGTGKVEKRPRKEVKKRTTKHRRAKINTDQSGTVSPETANAIGNAIGIGIGIGIGRGRTGDHNSRDMMQHDSR